MEQEAVYFKKYGISKSIFHKIKYLLILMKQVLKEYNHQIKTYVVKIRLST